MLGQQNPAPHPPILSLHQAQCLGDVLKNIASYGTVCNGCNRLTYVDDDGEHITISHESEFREAAAQQFPLKLIVNSVSDDQGLQPARSGSASNGSTQQSFLEEKEEAETGRVQAQLVATPPSPSDSVDTLLPPMQQAMTPTSVRAQPCAPPTSPSADYVSRLNLRLQEMHGCAVNASKVRYEAEQLGEQSFRCRVVLAFGKAGDGEYAWSGSHGSKKHAKQEGARLALARLVPDSSEKEDRPFLEEPSPTLRIDGSPVGGGAVGGAIEGGADSTTDLVNSDLMAKQSPAAVGANAGTSDMTKAAPGGASDISSWLCQIGIAEDDVNSVLLHFNKPEYGVKTLRELFALEESDVDEILRSLPLAKKRLIKISLKDPPKFSA